MSGTGARVRETCRGDSFRVMTSDVCQGIAILLLLISVAVGTASPKPSYSWARGWLNVPYTDGSYHKMTVNFGLTQYVQCVNDVPPGSDFYGCNSFDLGDIQNSSCKVAGQGVIAAAVFAMLFGLISIFFLHAEVNGKAAFGRRIPFPRLILNLFSFLSFLLYIVVTATWFEKCYNGVADITWFVNTGAHQYLKDCYAGYAVATAIIAIVFSFCSYLFAFWRTCSPNKSEAVKQPAVPVTTATSAAALAGSVAWSSASNLTPAQIGAAAAGAQQVAQYGNAYSNYANSYNNEPAPPAYNEATEGTTRGGYGGGSYGGAYGGDQAGGNQTGGGYTSGGYGY